MFNNNNFNSVPPRTALAYGTLILLTIILMVVMVIFMVGLWRSSFPVNPSSLEQTIFVVEKGEGFQEVLNNLGRQGFIRSNFSLNAFLVVSGMAKNLKAGNYELSPSMSAFEIIGKIYRGEVVKEKITIIEGWNLRDIGLYFEGKGMFQAEELFEAVGFPLVDYRKDNDLPKLADFGSDFGFLKDKPSYVSLEGYLFPDTYEINKGESLNEIVRRLLNNFDKKVFSVLKQEISAQDKSIFDIITMASMIEREVLDYGDKKLVSGILWKRLESGMPLQVDATVNYITGRKNSGPTSLEKKIDSPYNTYKYKGLPFGPISNPGIESIRASLYPQESDFWYYLSTPEGKTIFSKTLKEHNAAINEYLR